MTLIQIPPSLHEVLGQRQSLLDLVAVGVAALAGGLAFAAGVEWGVGDPSVWRKLLALILAVDIAAGCVANFTRGTSAYYAASRRRRHYFIALHLHLLVMAWLMQWPLLPLALVWAFTICASVAVVTLTGRRGQPVLAALLVSLGMLALPWLAIDPVVQGVSLLFLIKLVYAFAVDHYGDAAGPLR